jgi:site-specific recombinase XerD
VEAAGVERFTWHSLRHDFASQLCIKRVDLRTVQELMCHADNKQTARYAEIGGERKQNAVELLAG